MFDVDLENKEFTEKDLELLSHEARRSYTENTLRFFSASKSFLFTTWFGQLDFYEDDP